MYLFVFSKCSLSFSVNTFLHHTAEFLSCCCSLGTSVFLTIQGVVADVKLRHLVQTNVPFNNDKKINNETKNTSATSVHLHERRQCFV